MPIVLERDPATGRILRSTGRLTGEVSLLPPGTRQAARRAVLKGMSFKGSRLDMQRIATQAHLNVTDAVYRGDPQMTMWLLDKTTFNDSGTLDVLMKDADLSTLDGVIATGQAVMQLMVEGEITIGQTDKALRTLKEYAALRMADELRKLEATLVQVEAERTKNSAADTVPSQLEADQMPTWGRLQDKVVASPPADIHAYRHVLD